MIIPLYSFSSRLRFLVAFALTDKAASAEHAAEDMAFVRAFNDARARLLR